MTGNRSPEGDGDNRDERRHVKGSYGFKILSKTKQLSLGNLLEVVGNVIEHTEVEG